ncbi:MAG: hypothetical protein DA407_12850 [Bacteroidetes bacterium]|nr:MAG: hypothetical protein DA407_12850 [Bacteroidota bacterium]
MNNDLIKSTTWWQKNWKWSVPTSVVFIIIIVSIFLSGFGDTLGNYSKAYSDSKLYNDAIKIVRENNRVKETLGHIEDINNMTILNGYVEYADDNSSVKTTIKVSGEHGKAMLDIFAHLINDTWSFDALNIRIKNPPENKETIEIIKLVE